MKSLSKFFVLFTFVYGFVGCHDDNDNDRRIYFYDEPAIVESLDTDTVIKSAHGRVLVNSLDNSLKVGDLLWTAFEVNLDDKKSTTKDLHTATNFRYHFVDSSKVIIPADAEAFEDNLADDYSEDIHTAVLYKDYVDSLLFFGFRHETSVEVGYVYEIILDPSNEAKIPTFYIRAKKVTAVPASVRGSAKNSGEIIYAFDMSDFVKYYKNDISNNGPVKFNLKYKTKTQEGKDIYKGFQSNPLSWHIE
jgi:hypothetical protein